MDDVFLTNYSKITFLEKIKCSLNKCKEFYFSVSFIKKAGLCLIEKEIEEALIRGVKGKIMTSTYQNFTDIASLKTFLKFKDNYKNFTCHIDFNSFGDNGFHSKGYIFVYDESYELIVGSSNITRYALLKNIEWNVSLFSNLKFNSINLAMQEFQSLWDKTLELTPDLVEKYNSVLDYAIEKWDMDYFDANNDIIKPNYMQRRALKELSKNRDLGVKRSLVVAATGSGKTYLAAFDARNYGSRRLLFVVHRDTILFEALKTFESIFRAERSYGIFNGNIKDTDCDFIFSTNSMLSRHLDEFDKDEFDYIILDECHHSTSKSYQKIIEYFDPGFILGLTATPERMDNEDVFGIFENNVPFELRLRDAIINNLVVPFKYYAIRDEFADYSSNDKNKIAREISRSNNIEFIVSQIKKYRKPTEKLKCIAFCSSINHSDIMANQFSIYGYDVISLTGSSDTGNRIKAFKRLQDDSDSLEIICAVDILNEGVDIPSINMVLFLRPTESSTIFIQQLGRGLRKYENKEYLTVLDFIGNNYERSVQIALALGSLAKTTYTEKTYLKSMVETNFNTLNIPGVEIFFDDLAKTEIISHLDKVNFNCKDFLRQDYLNFKKYLKLETYPSHMDYLNSDIAPDFLRFLKSQIGDKNSSYYNFLRKIGEEIPCFNHEEIDLINNISDFLPLVRLDEYLIISNLLEGKDISDIKGYKVSSETSKNAYQRLIKKNIIKENKLNITNINQDLFDYLQDLLEYGITRYHNEFGDYEGKFKLIGNYYKEQIQMIRLKDSSMSVKGTEFDIITKETYCYVNLNKNLKSDLRLAYKDKFINSKVFEWESEKNTTLTSAVGKKIIATEVVHLFVRKMVKEDGITLPFTYFGTGKFRNIRESYTEENDKKYNTLLMDIVLDNEVSEEYWLDFEIKGKENEES